MQSNGFDQFKVSSDYVTSEPLRNAVYVSIALGRPLLIRGEPGTGKTLLAYSISRGLDKKLIKWNIKSTTKAQDGLYVYDTVQRLNDSRFGDKDVSDINQYIKLGKLGQAFIASEQEVLLIDEIDRSDEEFEAFLLEILSDFQVSIPEIGTLKATHKPLVVITSNRTRDIHDALKRRCLYHWIDYPDLEKEKQIIRTRIPRIEESLAGQVAGFMQTIRREDLMKKPGISETLDWAEALIKLNQGVLDQQIVEQTLGCILKYREDIQKFKSSIWTDPDKRSQLLAACRITPC